MRFAYWTTKDTDTLSEYVVLIAFSRQQWSRERASMLRYTYIVSVLFNSPLCYQRSQSYRKQSRMRSMFRRKQEAADPQTSTSTLHIRS